MIFQKRKHKKPHNNKNKGFQMTDKVNTVESVPGKPAEDWMAKKWRPMMGWTYMLICFLDMAIFPVLWSILQASLKQPITQWNPLTLQGAGLFHISMGAVLGIAAYGRTQEKLGNASTATTTVPTSTPSTSFSSPSSFSSPATPAATSSGFGSGFDTPAPSSSISPTPITGKGKAKIED
jgi:hypothetical protein